MDGAVSRDFGGLQMTRLAVVTGAVGDIGRATVEAFIEAGWEVTGLDQSSDPDLPKGGKLERIDVSDPAQVEAFFETLADSRDRLDALVNNAATQLNTPMLEMKPEEWDRVQAVNLRSVFLMCRGAYPLLRSARGAVVNVSSVDAIATSVNVAAYAASKGGVLALSRALALEFGPDGVRVNAVLLGQWTRRCCVTD